MESDFRAAYKRLKSRTFIWLGLYLCMAALSGPLLFVILSRTTSGGTYPIILISALTSLSVISGIAYIQMRWIVRPFLALRDHIGHISPTSSGLKAPDLSDLHFGQEVSVNILEAVHSLYEYLSEVTSLAELPSSERLQLNQLLDRLPVPLVVLDRLGMIVYANPNALGLTDNSEETLEGQEVYQILPLREKDVAILPAWIRACQKRKTPDDVVWRDVTFAGPFRRLYWFDAYAHYSPTEDDTQPAIILFLIDKTTHHEASSAPPKKKTSRPKS